MAVSVMDSEYQHGMSTLYHNDHGRHSYPSLPNLQFSEPAHHGSHTLPPIQSYRPTMNQNNASYEQVSRSQHVPQHPGNMGYTTYSLSQAPYSGGMTQYTDNASFQQAPSHLSYSGNYAPTSQGQLPDHRSLQMGGMSGSQSVSSSLASSQQYQLPAATDQDFQSRTHVVGSQGRRGILPSDEGRPAASNNNTTSTTSSSNAISNSGVTQGKAAPLPPKDEDGKFPCPHCTKTYLHAKHLKRHLLRHTGDRPYSCALCSDTFSRSDILKRHFQKCSIRRGNPTGATHLSNSQSHLRRQQARRTNSTGAAIEGGYLASAPQTPTSLTFGEGGIAPVCLANTTPNIIARGDIPSHYDDGSNTHERRSINGPSAISRSTAGILSVHNGPASQASSGSTTPLNTIIQPHIPQTFTPDSTHHRVNSYTPTLSQSSSSNRSSIPHQPSSSTFDAGSLYWSSYQSAAREHSGNPQLPSPDHTEDHYKHGPSVKMPLSGMDQNGDMINGLFNREHGGHGETMNGWSTSSAHYPARSSSTHPFLPVGHIQ